MTSQKFVLAQCLAALGLGFALVSLPVVLAFFDAVSLVLAWFAEHILRAVNWDVLRSGTVLRQLVSGHAVEVTEACDGRGIVVSWAAISLILPSSARARLLGFGLGFLTIQVFNLARVIVLFIALPAGTTLFDTAHYFVFPLATSVLLIGLAAWMHPRLTRPALLSCAVLPVLALAWYLVTDAVSAAVLVPAAQLVIALPGVPEVGAIAERSIGWSVGSHLPQSLDPLRFYLAPLYPPDFALALPVLVATALAAHRGLSYLALALALMVGALAVGAITEIWGLAVAQNVATIAMPVAQGQVQLMAYDPPSALALGALRVLQNVLVHLNLLVMPVLILTTTKALRA